MRHETTTAIAHRQSGIAIIGPTLPYRTGIAQYTSQLAAALRTRARVQTISFWRQYPGWLYPGSTDYKLTPAMTREPDVEYRINVYSPLSWRRSADSIIKNGCDVAILDWWTLFWQPGFTYMTRRLRKHGVRTIYLCHNLFNHQTGGIMGLVDKLLAKPSRWMLKQADGYIVQSSEKRRELVQLKPGAKVLFRPHPIYDRFPPAKRHLAKRGRLELLFFGVIRPYKGLDVLLTALDELHDKDVFVTIAGEPWGDVAGLRRQIEAADIPNVELHLEHVSDTDTADYFSRADAVVLPYRSATGSGVVALAYHYGKPVIASSVGGLNDVVEPGKTGWLVPPASPEALAQAIVTATRQSLAAMRPAIKTFCTGNSWDAMAEAIVTFTGEV